MGVSKIGVYRTSKITIQWGQASSTIKFWGPVFSDKPTINGSMRTPAVDVRRDDNPKCGQWFLCTWKLYKLYTYSETVHQQWVVDATPNRQLRELICRGSMVSSGMAAHDVESPFRSCPFQITPTTISPTHHWSLPLVWIDSQGQSAAGVGTDYLLYNHIIYIIYMYIIIYCIYIIINIILIQWGIFRIFTHWKSFESGGPLGATRVFLSSSVASTVGIQWPFSLRPVFTVCICRCPSMTISWTQVMGTKKLVKWEPKGWAISKFNWKKNCYIGCGKLE